MKLDRLLAIVMYLLNRKKVTAKELAEHFEVSIRSIYRDLEAINQAGIPIVSYQGTNGGYSIMESYTIDKQVLSGDEMNAITVALKGLDKTLDDRKLKAIIEKIDLLNTNPNSENIGSNNKYFIDFTPWGISAKQKEKISLIEQAIDHCRLIAFSYTNIQGTATVREVEPMLLVLRGTSWYLYGYCRLKEDYRIFKITRMFDLTAKEQRFARREERFHESILNQERDTGKEPVMIVMKFGLKVRTRVEEWFRDEDMAERDGALIVRVSYPEDEWLYGFILSFGDQVEVLEPEHLREIIAQKGRSIGNIYA